VTEHVAPALPVAVKVEPDTVHPSVVANENAPVVVPPLAVNASVEPNVIVEADVTVTVAWSAPEIVPQRKPSLSMMEPVYATMPTATMPAGHSTVSRCDGDDVPAFDQPNTVLLVERASPRGIDPHIN
jgi:hypothetical protein